MNDEYYMSVALKQAEKAAKKGDVPVGAVIVKDGKIIAKGYNQKQNKKNAVYHAEMLVIQKSCKKSKSWYLDDCILYVTLEPCLMCAGAIIQSRIKKIVYATSSPKFGYISSIDKIENQKNNHIPTIKEGVCKEQSIKLLKKFFKDKRI